MPNYRKFRISYTLPNQPLQKIDVTASDLNSARVIVMAMFNQKVLIGFIEELR
jgi:hypothetical protein